MKNLNHHSIPYDCRHDPAHPDHLVCVLKREEIIKNPLSRFFFHRYHRHYHRRHPFGAHHLVADIVILASIAGLLALNVVDAILLPTLFPRIVDLTISTDRAELTSGQETTFKIHVTNTTGSTIRDVRITLHPSPLFTGTELSGDDTIKQFGQTVYLGDIKNKKRAEFLVRTTPVGPLDAQLVLGTTIEYSLHSSSERVKEERRFLASIGESIVHASLSAPARIPGNQRFTGHIALNTDDTLFTRGTTVLSLPKSFHLESFGTSTSGTAIPVDLTKPLSIPFTGRFAHGTTGTKSLRVNVFALHDGKEMLSETTQTAIAVVAPPLSVRIESVDSHNILTPGGKGSFRILWENASADPVRDATVGVKITGNFAARSSLSSPDGTRSQKGVLVWTKNHKKSLDELLPGKKGSAEFSFDIKPVLDLSSFKPDHDFRITLRPFATYTFGDSERGELFDIPLKMDVASHLLVSGGARYTTPEGEQVGRGPLPPRVGRETRYVIALFAKAGIHPVSNTTITARLGKGVSVPTQPFIQSKDIQYDAHSRTITWNVPALPPGFGGDATVSRSTLFELALKPTADLTGRSATLLYDIRAQGIDTTLDARIESSTPTITTLLSDDPRATGKGIVRP